ncbi:Ribosomal protein S12 methylthiotransferase RimO [Fundidesulfovibrio magnetotacticus]|uniref:Ribosomal protein S12 methylthiotransferase RimO n=2 Tax=Fundidesulfovibrio magnetotacticus TaxID=2730080 RepID=A0A6V8LP99_9BACT|nr:Ribosomal protein S12 methylthiotransferase RimO [Fundidesulfovibrio magnetotacticus]
MSRAEMDRLGWDALDVLLVTGDAYVDHPSFGAALLGRWLTAHGFRTGIAAQPRWDDPDAVAAMGRPRLFAGVTAGALDSMLAHYTAFRRKRSEDAYTPGGKAGARPNRASIVYANLVRRACPGLPVVLGGIEASLRRVSHYDFWSDSLRRSIVLDAKADAVLYGMAEHSLLALAEALEQGEDIAAALWDIPGAAFAVPGSASLEDALELPSHESIEAEPAQLVKATLLLERHVHQNRRAACQRSGERMVVLTAPGEGLEAEALDALYTLPFTRRAHPSYDKPVPAEAMMAGSLNIHRGCAGGCSFCTLALHQGRRIRSRSARSVLEEARALAGTRGFNGSVSDVGGPSANMWGAACTGDMASCARSSCLTPRLCRHFSARQRDFVSLLRSVSAVPGVRHVRVASGWRMDLGLADPEALGAMVREFTGGQAKVAPEHRAGHVLRLMRKPAFETFERFLKLFERESARAGKEQYVVPYLMSAFPGCTVRDMQELAAWLGGRGWRPDQVQCFIPLPGTAAAAMYYAGVDLEGRPIPVARGDAERRAQHDILAGQGGAEHAARREAIRKPAGAARAGGPRGDSPSRPGGRSPGQTGRGAGRNSGRNSGRGRKG